ERNVRALRVPDRRRRLRRPDGHRDADACADRRHGPSSPRGARCVPESYRRLRGRDGVSSTAALEAIDRILNRGGDANDVLRAVVHALVARGGCAWAGILFDAEGELALGPQAGEPRPDARMQLPIVFQAVRVAELVVDG